MFVAVHPLVNVNHSMSTGVPVSSGVMVNRTLNFLPNGIALSLVVSLLDCLLQCLHDLFRLVHTQISTYRLANVLMLRAGVVPVEVKRHQARRATPMIGDLYPINHAFVIVNRDSEPSAGIVDTAKGQVERFRLNAQGPSTLS